MGQGPAPHPAGESGSPTPHEVKGSRSWGGLGVRGRGHRPPDMQVPWVTLTRLGTPPPPLPRGQPRAPRPSQCLGDPTRGSAAQEMTQVRRNLASPSWSGHGDPAGGPWGLEVGGPGVVATSREAPSPRGPPHICTGFWGKQPAFSHTAQTAIKEISLPDVLLFSMEAEASMR